MARNFRNRIEAIHKRIGDPGSCRCLCGSIPTMLWTCNRASPWQLDGPNPGQKQKTLPPDWFDTHPGICPHCGLPYQDSEEQTKLIYIHINYDDHHEECKGCHQAGHPIEPCPMLIEDAKEYGWPEIYEHDIPWTGSENTEKEA